MRCPPVMSHSTDVSCSGPLPSSDLFNHAFVFSLIQMFVLSGPVRDV